MTALDTAYETLKAAIGTESPPGDWFTVTQDQVNQFADVTRRPSMDPCGYRARQKRSVWRPDRPRPSDPFHPRLSGSHRCTVQHAEVGRAKNGNQLRL